MQKKAASEMIAQRYKMSADDAQDWFAGVKWNTDGSVDKEALKRVVENLIRAGMLPAGSLEDLETRICY